MDGCRNKFMDFFYWKMKTFSPTEMWTAITWKIKPVCYQWATLTQHFSDCLQPVFKGRDENISKNERRQDSVNSVEGRPPRSTINQLENLSLVDVDQLENVSLDVD